MANLWISKNARWEAALDWCQWLIGFNAHADTGINVFLGPLRFGRNSDRTVAALTYNPITPLAQRCQTATDW